MLCLEEIRDRVLEASGEVNMLFSTLEGYEVKAKKLKSKKQWIEQGQAIIQTTAKETQELLRFHILELVQAGLEACFPGKYNFLLNFEIKRGRTEAKMVLERDGQELDPTDSNGGGLVDIIAFSLRIAVWALSKSSPIIILDEPLKFLSPDLRPFAGEMMRRVSSDLGLQIIMVSHMDALIESADKVFHVRQVDGKSIVKSR